MDQTLARGSRHFAPLFPKADWRGYALGIASVAIAFALRWMLNPLLGEHQPYVTFFAAVAITAMYGSLEGSVLALVLSVLAVLFFFLPPTSSSQAQELESRIGLVTYTFSAGLICFIGESLRNTRRRMAAEFQARVQAEGEMLKHADDLEHRVEERTRALQEAMGEMESFSYSISHDMRAPLRAMHQFSEIVLEDYGHVLDEQGRNYLERIRGSARRLDKLIEDVLTYTRVARIESDSAPERVDLEKLIHEILTESPAFHHNAANIHVQSPLLPVLGQQASLTQALSNLLINAVKFVSPGVVPCVTVRTESCQRQVRLWVEDNGIGIAPQHHESIFKIFERLHTSKKYDGTGVGLAIVRKAVERMGGELGLESELGKGSKFWIQLPAADGKSSPL